MRHAPSVKHVLLLLLLLSSCRRAGPPAPGRISLIAGGDVTLGYHFEELFDARLAAGERREELLAYPFARVRSALSEADLAVVNLECPFTLRGEKLVKNFNFRARPELVETLTLAGIDAVSLANNHAMDYGAQGLLDTLETLDRAGIGHFGAGRDLAEARRPLIVERRGIRVALLGYFFLGDRNIEPEAVLATGSAPGVAGTYKDLEGMRRMLAEDIAAAKRQADVVVPFFHWGREATQELEPYQPELAALAISAGAGLVLGSHPHVLQGVAVEQGVPVVYSLGNFVFGGNSNPKVKDAGLFRVELGRSGVEEAQLLPIQVTRLPEGPFQPFLLEGAERRRVLDEVAAFPHGGGASLPSLSR